MNFSIYNHVPICAIEIDYAVAFISKLNVNWHRGVKSKSCAVLPKIARDRRARNVCSAVIRHIYYCFNHVVIYGHVDCRTNLLHSFHHGRPRNVCKCARDVDIESNCIRRWRCQCQCYCIFSIERWSNYVSDELHECRERRDQVKYTVSFWYDSQRYLIRICAIER